MFKCEKCGNNTKPREKMHRQPILFRDVTYEIKGKKGSVKYKTGKEIVKEINLCDDCFIGGKNERERQFNTVNCTK